MNRDPADPAADTWVLVFTGTPGSPPVAVRVRRLLKLAARLGLKCIEVSERTDAEVIDGLRAEVLRLTEQVERLTRRARGRQRATAG